MKTERNERMIGKRDVNDRRLYTVRVVESTNDRTQCKITVYK